MLLIALMTPSPGNGLPDVSIAPKMEQAFAAMAALEMGAIANPDENRMVGHYWLRAPHLAPTPEITREITTTLGEIKVYDKEGTNHNPGDQGAEAPANAPNSWKPGRDLYANEGAVGQEFLNNPAS